MRKLCVDWRKQFLIDWRYKQKTSDSLIPTNDDIKYEDNDRIARRLKRKKIIKVTNYIRDNIKQIKAEAENGQQDSQSMLRVYNEVINNHDLTSDDKYEKMLYWFFAEFQQFYAEA